MCRTHLSHYVEALPIAYMGPCRVGSAGLGWLNNFMHTVNSTFPHPEHILINNGVPGNHFGSFAKGACLENLIPKQPDLVIFEHLPYLEGNSPKASLIALEQLVNRLQYNFNLSSFPAMIFINMHLIMDSNYTISRGTINREKAANCLREIRLCSSLCAGDQFEGLPSVDSNATSAEIVTNLAAAHYGAASLSYTNLVTALMESSARGNLTECEVFATVFKDHIHPSYRGHLLLADLLVNYLDGALEHFGNIHNSKQQQEEEEVTAADSGESSSSIARLGRETPDERGGVTPMDPQSVSVPLMRCFGPMVQAVTPLHEEDVASHGLQTSSVIDVVKAEGWAYVEVDENKTKPGWISTTPGSILRMSIDTNFGSLVDPHFITLAVLASYQHMGQAEVTCVSGCKCQKSKIDAHETVYSHSIPKLHSFLLTETAAPKSSKKGTAGSGTTDGASGAAGSGSITGSGSATNSSGSASRGAAAICVIQLEVLKDTKSGEHKFKVLQLAIKTFINVSASLPHAATL